ncbi:hypothetical protein ACWEIJ_27115 [Lentzea sp. NPDC004789]
MKDEIFGGRTFRVTSVSHGDGDSFEFVIEGGPAVAITQYDGDSSRALYVSVDGEIELVALEEMIKYTKQRFVLE